MALSKIDDPAPFLENFPIWLRKQPPGKHNRCTNFEYPGEHIDPDNAKMAADPKTQEWWTYCEPCHKPLEDREEGEWWADMEPAYYLA
jgi:Uncharacterized conserved protein